MIAAVGALTGAVRGAVERAEQDLARIARVALLTHTRLVGLPAPSPARTVGRATLHSEKTKTPCFSNKEDMI